MFFAASVLNGLVSFIIYYISFFLDAIFLLSVFLFTEFIYKTIYEVELKIGAEKFLFETKEKELNNFEMHKFFNVTKYTINVIYYVLKSFEINYNRFKYDL